ncbi:MAG: sterol desaturase family protein [Pseudomonadota bacterium]|nr:sterol desaturase family protein [Pseudomonadota bacterium]
MPFGLARGWRYLRLLSLEHGKFAYRADFAAYGVAVAAMAVALAVDAPRKQGLALVLWIAAGLVAWSLIEYLFHRFLLHGMSPFREWHALHHARPTARIASPTLFSAALIAGLVALPAWLMWGGWPACALTLGVTFGYYAYAITHHATHHWRAAGPWARGRKRWHAAHHHANDAARCFGVTSGIWDVVFRTL